MLDVLGIRLVAQDELADLGQCVHEHKDPHEVVFDKYFARNERHVLEDEGLENERTWSI
jgi:hypothetical protein